MLNIHMHYGLHINGIVQHSNILTQKKKQNRPYLNRGASVFRLVSSKVLLVEVGVQQIYSNPFIFQLVLIKEASSRHSPLFFLWILSRRTPNVQHSTHCSTQIIFYQRLTKTISTNFFKREVIPLHCIVLINILFNDRP